jgi:hypothetical protein
VGGHLAPVLHTTVRAVRHMAVHETLGSCIGIGHEAIAESFHALLGSHRCLRRRRAGRSCGSRRIHRFFPQVAPLRNITLSTPFSGARHFAPPFRVQPFPGHNVIPRYYASADSCRFNRALQRRLPGYPAFRQVSRVRSLPFPPSTRPIYSEQPLAARTSLCCASSSGCP